MGGGGKGGTTTSSQTVSIPPEVLARYNAVNARAETTAEQPFHQYGGEFVAPLTPTQVAGTQATNAAAGQAQPYYGAATALTLGGAKNVGPLTQGQIGYYQNPYTQAVVNPTVQALQQQQGQQLAEQQAQAIKGGAFGGDRANLQRSQLQGQQNLALGQAIAPLYQQGYGQAVQTAQTQQGVVASDLARQMQAGQQVAGLGTGAQQASLQGAQAQLAAGQVGQQTQQAQDTAQYQQFLQERGYPFQVAQFLANIAMGTGALSGSTTSGTQTAPGGFFSDKRLKNDVKEIGETHDGQPIYSYKYKGDDRTQIGLMAQDVEKKHPDAVGLMGGYKTVDYKKATEDAERTHKDMGGGLMPQMLTPEMEAGDTTPSVEMSSMTPENADAAYNSSSPNPTYGWGPRQDAAVALRGSWKDLPASRLTNTPDDRNYGGSEAMRNAPGARYGRAMGGGLMPDGYDYSSMGGAVTSDMAGEAFERGGYVGGGLVGNDDWAQIIAANKQALGVYGGQQPMGGGSPGATGIVPAANIPVPKPIEAAKMSMPAQRPSGMSTAMQTGRDIASTYKGGKEALLGSAADKSSGLIGGGGSTSGKSVFGEFKDWWDKPSAAHGGLIVPRHAYALGGSEDSQGDEAVPYDPSDVMGSKDPMEGVLKAGSQKHELLKPAQMQTSGGGGGGSKLGIGKAAGSMIGTAIGGPIGGMAGSFLGSMLPFAGGGLVPRQGYDEGGPTEAPSLDKDPTLGLISKFEGFRERPYWDVNALRTGFGSDTVTLPDGTVQRVGENTRVSVEDAKRDLARRAGEFQGQIKGSVGEENWGKLDPNTQAALTSVTYNYGRLPKSVAEAVQSGDKASIGAAVNALGTHNEGVNARRRAEEASLIHPEGKYSASSGAPRPPGLVGAGAQPAAPSGEGKKSIGDVVTSEGFIVPALGFLGSMLASNRPNLGQALGEGIMGGVGAYQTQKKQTAELAKGVLDIVKDRFHLSTDPKTGQTVYFNKATGTPISAGQYAQAVGGIADSLGVPRGVLGIPTTGIDLPSISGGPTKPGEFSRPGVTAKPGEEAKPGEVAPKEQKIAGTLDEADLRKMSPTQLMEFARKNKERFGLVDDRDPDLMQERIADYRRNARSASLAGDTAGAATSDMLAKDEQKRMDDYLRDAVKIHVMNNEELTKSNVQSSQKYMDNVITRIESHDNARGALKRLADIYSGYMPSRAAEIKANIGDWANQFGVDLGPNFNAAAPDEAIKIATAQAISAAGASQLGRAPKVVLENELRTVPSPSLSPGAIYSILGRTIGEIDYANARDRAYAEKGAGTDVAKFLSDFTKREKPTTYIGNAFAEIPVVKGMKREEIDSLMKSYKFTPKQEGEAAPQAGAEQPREAAPAAPSAPEPIRNLPGLVYSPSRNQYRDAQGNLYNSSGQKVQ
jgi:GH24 family phage-related lysozyme (muramidase)